MTVNLPDGNVVAPQEPGQPQPQPDALTPLEKKYGGDKAKMNEGYWNLNQELARKNETLTTAAQRMQQLETALAMLIGGGNGQPVDPVTSLAQELGLQSPEPVKRGIRTEVESVLSELFGPLTRQIEADEALEAEIDNFPQLRSEARAFMRDNPEVAATFNAVRQHNPKEAWTFAIQKTLIAKHQGKQPVQPNPLSLPGGAAPVGRGEPQGAPQQAQKEAEALDYGKKFGDMRHYRHERFAGTSVQRAVHRALQQAGMLPEGDNQGW